MTVTVRTFPLVLSREEALARAEGKGNWIGKLLLRGTDLHELRSHFVEYALLEYEALHSPNVIARRLFGDGQRKRQLCRVIANGTTGAAAWAEELPEGLVDVTVDEGQVQPATVSPEEMESRGRRLVFRVLRRRVGGYPEINLVGRRIVHRPFYVALYGVPVEGTRIRYLPIAADGWGTNRAF